MKNSQYLQYILADTGLYKAFHLFCQSIWCQETLEFVYKVQGYKSKPSKKKAIEIVDTFVTGNKQVNFDDGVLTNDLKAKKQNYELLRTQAKNKNKIARIGSSDERKAEPAIFDEALGVAI